MTEPKPSKMRQLAWFIGLWLAGVMAVAVVAYGLRLWLL